MLCPNDVFTNTSYVCGHMYVYLMPDAMPRSIPTSWITVNWPSFFWKEDKQDKEILFYIWFQWLQCHTSCHGNDDSHPCSLCLVSPLCRCTSGRSSRTYPHVLPCFMGRPEPRLRIPVILRRAHCCPAAQSHTMFYEISLWYRHQLSCVSLEQVAATFLL